MLRIVSFKVVYRETCAVSGDLIASPFSVVVLASFFLFLSGFFLVVPPAALFAGRFVSLVTSQIQQ